MAYLASSDKALEDSLLNFGKKLSNEYNTKIANNDNTPIMIELSPEISSGWCELCESKRVKYYILSQDKQDSNALFVCDDPACLTLGNLQKLGD